MSMQENRQFQWHVRRQRLLLFATIAQVGASFTQQGVVVIGTFFAIGYHLSLAQMGIVTSSISFGWVISGFFVGTLIDSFGPRTVLGVGVIIVACVTLLAAIESNIILIVIDLVILGIALSTIPLSGTKSVLLAWSREERGLPMGIRQMGVPAGSMLAALVLPSLASVIGIHSIFVLFSLELLLAGGAFVSILPKQPFSHRQAHTQSFRDFLSILRVIAIPGICGFLLAWGQYVLLTFSIPYLHIVSHFSIPLAGLVLSLSQVGGGIARITLGALSDRIGGRRDRVLFGTALIAMLLAVVVAFLPAQFSIALIMLLWFLLGFVMVGWNALMLTWSGERVASRYAGSAMGLTTSFILSGAVICAPVFGFIVEKSGSFRDAWLTLSGVLLIATLLLWWQNMRPQQQIAYQSRGVLSNTSLQEG